MTPLRVVGSTLRAGGLTPRMLAAWAGSDRLSALPHLVATQAGRPLTPASTLLALFVAGDDVPIARVPELDALHAHGVVDVIDDRVHARVSVLPLGPSLIVCDRIDTDDSLDVVCWPDDSSYHLALSLPREPDQTWLDLGCGSAFAALLRPDLGSRIVGADINARAVRYATLGCELSGIEQLRVVEADLGEGLPPELQTSYDLVTCNAPIPDPSDTPSRPHWRVTDTTFMERLFAHAAQLVAAGGTVVVHAALDALDPVLAAVPGDRVVVGYTPAGVRGFAVAWWRPDGEERLVRARRVLTDPRPHLTYEDRIDAMTGTLPPL